MPKFSIDETMRLAGLNTPESTPEQLPSDDVSSNRNFLDTTVASTMFHDDKARRKFKDLEFSAFVMRVRPLKIKGDLEERTSRIFANYIYDLQKAQESKDSQNKSKEKAKIYEIFAHISEVSGLLPQPDFEELMEYHDPEVPLNTLTEAGRKERILFEKKIELLVSRFPKFYCISEVEPQALDIWRVKFHDENFLYYGRAMSKLTDASYIRSEHFKKVLSGYSSDEKRQQEVKRVIESQTGTNSIVPGYSA